MNILSVYDGGPSDGEETEIIWYPNRPPGFVCTLTPRTPDWAFVYDITGEEDTYGRLILRPCVHRIAKARQMVK